MVATVSSSYRSLTQFEDEITPYHTGSLVDTIRFRRRDDLSQLRYEKRAERLRCLRKSFDSAEFMFEADLNEDYCDDHLTNHSANSFSGTVDSWTTTNAGDGWLCTTSSAGDTALGRPSPPESPIYSPCSTPTTVCADEVDGSVADRISEQMLRKSQQTRKQQPRQSVKKLRRRRPIEKIAMELYDQEGIDRDYAMFCRIDQSTDKNLYDVWHGLNTNWRLILRSIFSHNEAIRTEVLHRLTLRLGQNLIMPETLLNILSHGLMHGLVRILADRDGPRRVVNFMLTVQNKAPMVFPYLVDMAVVARFFKAISEIAQLNAEADLDSLLTFYEAILPTYVGKIRQNVNDNPLIPGLTSSHSSLSEVTLNYYGPMSTAIKMISPSTIETLVNSISVDFLEPRVVTKVLRVLMYIAEVTYLQLTQRAGNVFSVFPLLEAFHQSKLEESVSFLIEYHGNQQDDQQLTSSESSRQAVQLLTQFEIFYKECHHAFRQFHDQYRSHTGMQF